MMTSDVSFDYLRYDTEVLLMAYGGHRQVFTMPSLLSGRCWLFVSRDLVTSGFLNVLPTQRSLIFFGPSEANHAFLSYGCLWGDAETVLEEMRACARGLSLSQW